MPYGSIYKIVFPNGKHYIGLTTTSLEQRTKQHKFCAKNGDTKCLYNAIRKYDMVDTLELIEIDTADTLEELCEKEIGYIIEYNSYYMNENGYNMTYGGEGTFGYVRTEDVKQKISEISKKQWENPEAREQMSEIKKKYYEENPDAIKKNRESQIKYNQEHPEKGEIHGERMKIYYEENPEAREQMSEIKKKYFEKHPEAGKEHSEKMKKYFEKHPEAGKKHSEKIKKYYEDDPDARQKCSESQKKRFENPKEIEKMRERMKKYFEENKDARRKSSKGEHKPFDVFTIYGTFIKTFTYQFEAKEYLQKEYGITSNIIISAVLGGRQNSSAGFVFKYK